MEPRRRTAARIAAIALAAAAQAGGSVAAAADPPRSVGPQPPARPAPATPEDELRRALAQRLAAGGGEMVVRGADLGPAAPKAAAKPASKGEPPAGQAATDAARRARTHPGAAAQHGASPRAARAPEEVAWGYGEHDGPSAWHRLHPTFAACDGGRRQSPIRLREPDAVPAQLAPIRVEYPALPFSTERTRQDQLRVHVAPGGSIVARGTRYALQSIEFRMPAEEVLGERRAGMSIHLHHRSASGRIAIVAVPVEIGETAHPTIAALWGALPLEPLDVVGPVEEPAPLAPLLPAGSDHYQYIGSLTQPPCTEGVLWLVMRAPIVVSAAQFDAYARLHAPNARPARDAGGRVVLIDGVTR